MWFVSSADLNRLEGVMGRVLSLVKPLGPKLEKLMAEVDDLKAAVAGIAEEVGKVGPAISDVQSKLASALVRIDELELGGDGGQAAADLAAIKAEVTGATTQLTTLRDALDEAFTSLDEVGTPPPDDDGA